MSLSPGTRLGPYAIESAIGAGGMGEVYKAVDTRLDRTVAIKVLPEHVASDPELRQRFDREARAISSLNHPHICTLHDVGCQDGVDFLVMEYLEGETLAQRLAKGALPLEQALQIGIQIADALDKAHRRGIVHRDLKPGNIFLVGSRARRPGPSDPALTAKLLDFGLAKLRPAAPAGATAVSAAPTVSSPLTGAGSLVGTFQYMAPEQLEGQEADARTDIFALGAVLYEMLTGRKAFEGKSQASLIAAILRGEPAPPSSLQPVTPEAVDRVVTTCLAKDPDDRWQTARDLLRELKWIEGGSGSARAASDADQRRGQRRTRLRERLAWAIAGISLLAAVGFGSARYLDVDDTPTRPQTLSLLLPEGAVVNVNTMALSPDGTTFAFAATSEGRTMLWVRPLDSTAARPLPGTEGADNPFWAPDSRTIGFGSLGRLRKVQLSGTPPETIGNVPILTGATWNRDDVIVFSDGINGVLYRIPANGGEAIPVTRRDETRDETGHVLPSFLPDGRHFLYFARSQGGGDQGVNIGSLDSPAGSRLLSADSGALYAPPVSGGPGHLLFVRANALLAQPFDAERLSLTGEAVAIGVGQVLPGQVRRQAPFSASDTGTLAYVTDNPETRLAWFDRSGMRQETLDLPPGGYEDVQLSPDAARVAVRRLDLQSGSKEIWLFDLRSGTSTPLTLRDADQNPRWLPDGQSLVLLRRGRGVSSEVVSKPADGTEAEEVLARNEEDQMVPSDWSPDGRSLVFRRVPAGELGSLWVLPLAGERQPWLVEGTERRGLNGRFSPVGRWIAYTAEATGQAEVYVQSFPDAGRRILVSRGGGLRPLWRRDGGELFFTADHPTSGVRTLFSVTVEPTGGTLRIGVAQPLMEVPFNPGSTNQYPYAVTPDGQRFLMIVPVEERPTTAVTVVLNWAAVLAPR
jgi:serine/threonine protein kinase/Tol biopolymer transport system component